MSALECPRGGDCAGESRKGQSRRHAGWVARDRAARVVGSRVGLVGVWSSGRRRGGRAGFGTWRGGWVGAVVVVLVVVCGLVLGVVRERQLHDGAREMTTREGYARAYRLTAMAPSPRSLSSWYRLCVVAWASASSCLRSARDSWGGPRGAQPREGCSPGCGCWLKLGRRELCALVLHHLLYAIAVSLVFRADSSSWSLWLGSHKR